MDVGLGMHVHTRDDKDVGAIDRLILDPGSGTVQAIVIRKGAILPRDVEVPMGAMEIESDGTVRLAYTADQIEALPAFDASRYVPPPPDYMPPEGYPLPGLYWPIEPGERVTLPAAAPDAAGAPGAARTRRDLQHAMIGEGSEVVSRDGKRVGVVHRLTYDPNTGELRHFEVRRGLFFTRDVEIPASLIAGLDDGLVQLTIDADGLREREGS